MPRSRLLILGVLITMLASIPLQGNCRDLLFAPIFSYETKGDDYSIQGLGPVIDYSTAHQALRPLYYRDAEEETSYILYPFGKSTPDHSYFIPFMMMQKEKAHPHLEVFPYFSGAYDGKDYWGVFPLYGHVLHRFGFDEAGFFLWPLYSRTEVSGAATHSFLWPIFSYRRDALFRVFPLYGQEKSVDSQSTFVLWPIFFHERSSSGSMIAALPLFRYEQGPTHWNASFLWPFFTYNRDDASGHTSADFPWPFVRTATGAYEETRIFPLYWTKTEGRGYRRQTVLWPLWTTTTSTGGQAGTEETTTSILILNRATDKTAPDGKTSRWLTVWPLVHATRDGEDRTWQFPALIPLYTDEGFCRTWGEFLTLARGSSDERTSRVDILWKSFFWESGPDMTRWSLLFLASRRTTPAYTEWGFLGNLLNIRMVRDQGAPGMAP